MSRKVILMLIPNLNFGGAQRVFYNLSFELSKRYRVVEVVFNFDAGHAFKTGNEVLSLDVRGGTNVFSKLYQFYIRCRRLTGIKERIKPFVCISHLEGADYINILSKTNEKVICCLHGSKLHDGNIKGLLGWVRKTILIPFLYKRADMLITVSQGIHQEFTRDFKIALNKTCWIPNFFYPHQIEIKAKKKIPKKYEVLFSDTRPTFINVGRLTLQKNHSALIELATRFNRINKAKWIVLGDGELLPSLIEQAERAGLKVYSYLNPESLHACDIYFLGYYDNPYPFISHSDWFILTSSWEGFPMVIGEAMACGTPVISTDCHTGPREFLSSDLDYSKAISECKLAEFGVLIPLLNPLIKDESLGQLASQLNEIIIHPKMRESYSCTGLKRVTQFEAEASMKNWYLAIEGKSL